MQDSKSVLVTDGSLQDRVRFPTSSYTRNEFYETTEDVRYHMKIWLVNGAQAADVPVGVDDLIEFKGDAKQVLEAHSVSVSCDNYSKSSARLQSEEIMLDDVPTIQVERAIEELASDHGIALKKTVSMGGRGYDRTGMRHVGVSYSFGSKRSDDEDWIRNPNNPQTYVEWVGGDIGTPGDLRPSQIEIKSVTTKTPQDSLTLRVKNLLPGFLTP